MQLIVGTDIQVTRRLAVIGTGGHGRVVADAANLVGWAVTFFDDQAGTTVGDWPIAGPVSKLFEKPGRFDGAIVAIGNNRTRLDLTRRLIASGANVASIVHPSATVSPRASFGVGTFLAAGAVVNTSARLGLAAIINTGATVDHDCIIADGVHLSPGVHLSGTVQVGEQTWIGTGSSVRNNVAIGRDSIVGVGSVVVTDIPDGVVVYGVPAQVARANSPQR